MKKSTLFSFFISSLILFSSCGTNTENKKEVALSPEVKDNIYAHYYLRYIADEGELKVEASFLTGNDKKTRKYKQFNSVQYGHTNMYLDPTISKDRAKYRQEWKDIDLQVMPFSFINDKGHREKDRVEVPIIEGFSFEGILSPGKDAVLTWQEGEPLSEGESFVLLFTDEKNRTISTVVHGPTIEKQIVIPGDKLKKLMPNTKYRFYIVRKGSFEERKTGFDGMLRIVNATTEYYSNMVEVESGR